MDLKNKTVAVIDNGLFVSFARKLAAGFKKVLYHTPFQSAFVKSNDIAVGAGFGDIEYCPQPLAYVDDIDLWVFLDLYHSGLQAFLREKGARVWGAGDGEELELDRWAFHKHAKELSLPIQGVERIHGIDKLKTFLKGVENKYVKTSFVRGDFETFHHISYELSEPRLNELQHHLGAKGADYEFLVEDEIPNAIEIGYDGFVVDGQFPETAMQAYEIKDEGMIGVVKPYDQLAKPVKDVNARFVPTFKNYQYRGFYCSEIRYTKDHKPYFIDPCCRLGTPSNELLQELFTDWPQTLWYGAEGKLVTPKQTAKFGALVVIQSEWAVNDWLCVHYPKELERWVKLRFWTRRGERNYVVPQHTGVPDVGCVVAVGDTLGQAIKLCRERAEQVKGFQVEVKVGALNKALERIREGEGFGIKF